MAVRIPNSFELEYCQHLGDLEEHGRLGQPNTRADTAAESKGGLCLGLFVVQKAEWVKYVWIRVDVRVMVNRPGIGVNLMADGKVEGTNQMFATTRVPLGINTPS